MIEQLIYRGGEQGFYLAAGEAEERLDARLRRLCVEPSPALRGARVYTRANLDALGTVMLMTAPGDALDAWLVHAFLIPEADYPSVMRGIPPIDGFAAKWYDGDPLPPIEPGQWTEGGRKIDYGCFRALFGDKPEPLARFLEAVSRLTTEADAPPVCAIAPGEPEAVSRLAYTAVETLMRVYPRLWRGKAIFRSLVGEPVDAAGCDVCFAARDCLADAEAMAKAGYTVIDAAAESSENVPEPGSANLALARALIGGDAAGAMRAAAEIRKSGIAARAKAETPGTPAIPVPFFAPRARRQAQRPVPEGDDPVARAQRFAKLLFAQVFEYSDLDNADDMAEQCGDFLKPRDRSYRLEFLNTFLGCVAESILPMLTLHRSVSQCEYVLSVAALMANGSWDALFHRATLDGTAPAQRAPAEDCVELLEKLCEAETEDEELGQDLLEWEIACAVFRGEAFEQKRVLDRLECLEAMDRKRRMSFRRDLAILAVDCARGVREHGDALCRVSLTAFFYANVRFNDFNLSFNWDELEALMDQLRSRTLARQYRAQLVRTVRIASDAWKHE